MRVVQYAAFDCTERKEFEEVQSIFENIWNHAIKRGERKAISGRQEQGISLGVLSNYLFII